MKFSNSYKMSGLKALILAGGFGTRLQGVVKDVPKPMASIAGKPFLEHQIRYLKQNGIEDIILGVHYKSEVIKSYFGEGMKQGVNITYSEEDVPLGTAGAIKLAEKYIDRPFFVLNGDSYANVNLSNFLDFHKSEKGLCSMIITETENDSQYGKVIMQGNKITTFSEKTPSQNTLTNGGIYIFEPEIFGIIPSGRNISLEREIFPELAKMGELRGKIHNGYFMDIGRPETYSQFKKDFLESIILTSDNTVRDALKKIKDSETGLVAIRDNKKFKGILTNRMIIDRLTLEKGNLEEKVGNICEMPNESAKEEDNEKGIREKLAKGISHLPIMNANGELVDMRFRNEEIKINDFPEISGKAPLRISFAGGGTDKEDFFGEYGGLTISSTIDKYCHATIIKRADSKIVIRSDMEEESVLDSRNLFYDGKHGLVKAITKIMKPNFGFEIYAHNDVPSGRGLGSSASFSVLIAKLIGELQGSRYNEYDLAKIAYNAEREELKIRGGWQDQYAAITGGFNFMEFDKTKNIINPLRLKSDITNALNDRLVLCYVGQEHNSGDVHQDQEKTLKENKEQTIQRLKQMKDIAIQTKNSLLFGDLDKVGELLHESWTLKRDVGNKISNSRIDNLYEIGKNNGAYGGKTLGAGGGGYILFYTPLKKRIPLVKILEDEGGEIMNFSFEDKGTQIWRN